MEQIRTATAAATAAVMDVVMRNYIAVIALLVLLLVAAFYVQFSSPIHEYFSNKKAALVRDAEDATAAKTTEVGYDVQEGEATQ
jgi:hypothetical protein